MMYSKKMKVISALWGMMLFAFFIILTMFGFRYKKLQPYKDLEDEMKKGSKQYVKLFDKEDLDEKITINSDELLSLELVKSMHIGKEKCHGYVLVQKSIFGKKYQSFIKCPNYKTKYYEKKQILS